MTLPSKLVMENIMDKQEKILNEIENLETQFTLIEETKPCHFIGNNNPASLSIEIADKLSLLYKKFSELQEKN